MIKLLNLISDGVVFQSQKEIFISGYVEKNQSVNLDFFQYNDVKISSRSCLSNQYGYFQATLPKLEASYNCYYLEVTCLSEVKRIKDIMIGEVLLIFGQSNAEYAFCLVKGNEAYKNVNNPHIRYIRSFSLDNILQYQTKRPYEAQDDVITTGWKKADRYESILQCSGLGFYIANQLNQKINVPVALICMGAGGTPISSWLSRQDIESNAVIKNYLISKDKYLDECAFNNQGDENYAQMSGMYNEKIHPIKNVQIKAAIWYQGEANAGSFDDACTYQVMLKTLLCRTRKDFNNLELPIFLCNIASYSYSNHFFDEAYLNESINYFAQYKNNYPIPVYDLPYEWLNGKPYFDWLEWHPIHPVIKLPLANRIVTFLLSQVYQSGAFTNNTYFKKMTIYDSDIYIEFTGCPLENPVKNIKGFAVSDEFNI